MDIGFVSLLIAALGILAHFVPVELGPKANPADTHYLPRPEWYYVPVFQWLRYWPGSLAVFGIIVITAFIARIFVGLPFIDRRRERRPWRRPVGVGLFTVVLLSLVSLAVLSHYSTATIQRSPTSSPYSARKPIGLWRRLSNGRCPRLHLPPASQAWTHWP